MRNQSRIEYRHIRDCVREAVLQPNRIDSINIMSHTEAATPFDCVDFPA
jgi:hypothetical protein